jgi:hypothetical protein
MDMLESLDYKNVDNAKCISKDYETTKARMAVQWQKITMNQQESDFFSKYCLTKNIINKTLKDGKISLRITAALAKELSVNPYFLTCDSENHSEYSDEQLGQFLIENGYEKPPESSEANAKSVDIKTNGIETGTDNILLKEAADMIKGIDDSREEAAGQKDMEKHVVHQNPYIQILRTRIENKLIAIAPEELGKIESISEKNAIELVKSLYLRAEYDEEIKRIAVIVKLAMLL